MSRTDPYSILIIHNKYRFAGGEDTVVLNEKKLLEEHGHPVYLYQKDNNCIQHIFQKLLLPFRTVFSLSACREVKKLIKEKHIDIIHVHNTLPLISFSVYYAAKKSGCGLVQTLHNFRFLCPNGVMYRDGHICEECVNSLTCSIRHACYRGSSLQTAIVAANLFIHRKIGTFRLPDAYIALTDFNKEKLSLLLNSGKIYVKPNFNPQPSQFDGEKKRSSFVYLSRLEENKGILSLLEAFRQMPEITLEIIGTGALEKEVRAFIKENHLKNIIFRGQQPHDKAMEILYHAKALIFPSKWYEGFPMTIAESYSLGTPVIGSRIGNTAGLIEEGRTGFLFDAASPDSLKAVVTHFINCSFDFKTMEENCRKIYAEKYNTELNYKLLLKIYKDARKL